MNRLRSPECHSRRDVIRRHATALAAFVCTLAFASALSAPAGAVGAGTGTGFGPHDPGVAPHASLNAHTVAPLTLANIVVTDLSTGDSQFFTTSTIAPVYPPQSAAGCNQAATDPMCLSLNSDGSNSFNLQVPAPGLTAGDIYDNVGSSMSVATPDGECGQLFDTSEQGTVTATAEVDQYDLTTSGQPALNAAAVQFDCTNDNLDISGTVAYNIVPTDPEDGYYVFGQQGEITGFGNDNYLAYLNGAQYYNLNGSIVGMAPTPDGAGYWMVGSDGGVFSSGDAGFYGSTGNLHLNKPVVGMAATPDGKGYWFVASDGGIFAYGDAGFYGSTGAIPSTSRSSAWRRRRTGRATGWWRPTAGSSPTATPASTARPGGMPLNKPIVGMAATPDGNGYWLVASDGGIFAYGDAGFYGSTGSIHLNEPIVGMQPTPDGQGLLVRGLPTAASSPTANAGFEGSLGGIGRDRRRRDLVGHLWQPGLTRADPARPGPTRPGPGGGRACGTPRARRASSGALLSRASSAPPTRAASPPRPRRRPTRRDPTPCRAPGGDGGVDTPDGVRVNRGAGAGCTTPVHLDEGRARHVVRVQVRLPGRQHRHHAGVGAVEDGRPLVARSWS